MPKRLGLLTVTIKSVTASHVYAQVFDFFAQSYTRLNHVEPSTVTQNDLKGRRSSPPFCITARIARKIGAEGGI